MTVSKEVFQVVNPLRSDVEQLRGGRVITGGFDQSCRLYRLLLVVALGVCVRLSIIMVSVVLRCRG